MTLADPPRAALRSVAAAIVRDDDRVLAIRRRDNDRWEPHGGVLELDEGIHEGIAREVLEETGLHVQPGPLTGVYKNMRHGIVALVFRCRVSGGSATERVSRRPRSTPRTAAAGATARHTVWRQPLSLSRGRRAMESLFCAVAAEPR